MQESMTSRQRVLCALGHREPDRVPIDLGGFQTGIHKIAYRQLLDHLGLDEEIRILDPVQQLAKPSEEILRRFRVDTRYLCAKGPDGFGGTITKNIRQGRLWHDLKDEFGVVWSMPDDQQMYMDISFHPLAEASIKDIENHPWPDGSDPSRFSDLRAKATALKNGTPYAICTGIGGVVYETCWYLRGLERWFMDMIENPAFCEAMLDRMLEFWTDFYSGFMREAGDLIDVVMIGDDLAGQDGPLFDPGFYVRVVKPRQKALVRHIKSLTKAKIWYHTCGGAKRYIPELIDNGVDILNPVQTSAAGMDPAELKREFGGKIAFWGAGIDSQHILPFAEPARVRDEVRRNMEIFKPGGGYVFNNIHNIQAGVPAANIVALFDAAYEFGFYGRR
jgi:uroporphyrinogen decarboxylase